MPVVPSMIVNLRFARSSDHGPGRTMSFMAVALPAERGHPEKELQTVVNQKRAVHKTPWTTLLMVASSIVTGGGIPGAHRTG